MTVSLTVADRAYDLEVIDYSVSQDATPLAPGDSSGGVGSINVSVASREDGPRHLRTGTILDRDISITDTEEILYSAFRGRGTIVGHTTKNSTVGGRTTLTAETALARLNTDRAAAPFYGARTTGNRVTYAINMVTNPSCETATTNYSGVPGTGGTAALTRANTAGLAYAGSYYANLAWTVAATDVGGIAYLQDSIVGGNPYTFSGNVGISTIAAQSMALTVEWLDVGNAIISSVVSRVANLTTTDYARLSVSATAPSNAVKARLNFKNNGGGENFVNWSIGAILRVDGVMVTSGLTLLDYFDGSTTNASWTGTANASASRLTITTEIDEGYDATIANAVRYYCGLVGITQTELDIDSSFEGVAVAYPAWEGNVWTYLKMLCTAVGAEIATSSGRIAFRKPRSHTVVTENHSGLSVSMDAQATARNVEVYNYNNKWLQNSPVYSATSVYSVDVRNSQVTTIRVPHSLTSVNNPQPVAALSSVEDYLGLGEYVVMDSNDVIVAPSRWTQLGGKVYAELAYGTYDTIELTIVGPTTSGDYSAPFRIGTAGVFGDVPAMTLTGGGVFTNKELVTLATAATLTQTSNETAPTVDNPFISTASQAADRAVLMAMDASGPAVTISGVISFDARSTGREFDLVVGGRLKHDDNIFRIKSAKFSPVSIDIDGEADVLFSDITEVYSITFDENNADHIGETFTVYNALWSGTATFADAMATAIQPSFDDINNIYSEMNFNDHARYPLIPMSTAPSATGSTGTTTGYGNTLYGSSPYGT